MTSFELDEHIFCVQSAKSLDIQMSTGYCMHCSFDNLFQQFDVCQQQAVLRARSCNSFWLSVVPLAAHQFDLICQEFCDALALQ